MAQQKILHSFVVKDKTLNDVKFAIKNPSRREWSNIAKFYKIKFNELQKEGFLTKDMIIANAEKQGNGLLSKETVEKLTNLRVESQMLQGEAVEAQIKHKDSPEKLDAELRKVYEKMAKTNQELVALEGYYQSSFENSVENQAQTYAILYTMYLISLIDRNGSYVEYFPGSTFLDKENADFDFADNEDYVYGLAREKLLTYTTLLFKGLLSTEEDFKNLDTKLAAETVTPTDPVANVAATDSPAS